MSGENASSPTSASFAARLLRWLDSPAPWVLLLLLGVAIRLRQYLFAASYWYDESFVLLTIRVRGFAALLGPQPYHLVSPPGYLWVVRGLYQLGGDGELLMRLPAFLAGIAALILMIPLACRLVGGRWAVWAFALLAVSSHAVAHGSEVHPYTVDLLVTEWILLCAVALIEPGQDARSRPWAVAGLGFAAVVGPWMSFPSAFVLAGASAALLLHARSRATLHAWIGWAAFNAAVGASGALLWWVSARHMGNYPGALEHWGHNGWGGFPDWRSPLAIGRWLISRPYEAANYGNRDLGVLLALLALVGGIVLVLRSSARATLLITPFALAVVAALLAKYPLAHRTTVFLLPCLWCLAAAGLGGLVHWAGRQAGKVAVFGWLLAAYGAAWTVPAMVWPSAGVDYRGAYQFVHAHTHPDDRIFAQMAVVYQTYYGADATVLKDEDFPTAERVAGESRLWTVFGDTRSDLRQRLESAGGHVILEHHVSGLVVFLFAPKQAPESAPKSERADRGR